MINVELKSMEQRLAVLEDKVETFVRIIEQAGLVSAQVERVDKAGFGFLIYQDQPLKLDAACVEPRAPAREQAAPGRLILIADDYGDTATLVAELLERDTLFQTISAQDGQEALDLALQRRPAACLLDIDMPRLDGTEVARRLRRELRSQRPYLVAVTGRRDLDAIALTGCFDKVLQKPVDIGELIEALGEM
jgi:CheY-like chemotaxis protein